MGWSMISMSIVQFREWGWGTEVQGGQSPRVRGRKTCAQQYATCAQQDPLPASPYEGVELWLHEQPRSNKQPLLHVAEDVGQAEVSAGVAVREAIVVDAEGIQQSCVEFVHVDRIGLSSSSCNPRPQQRYSAFAASVGSYPFAQRGLVHGTCRVSCLAR